MRFDSQILGLAIVFSVCTTTSFAKDAENQNDNKQLQIEKAPTNLDKGANAKDKKDTDSKKSTPEYKKANKEKAIKKGT
ncbi:MAG: hypothetical protein Q7U57_19940 [Methylovulum sp.]|nr:hypothetical protein [Methylovulum sp.]